MGSPAIGECRHRRLKSSATLFAYADRPLMAAHAPHPLSPKSINAAAARAAWPAFVAVDEGLDRLVRWEPAQDRIIWTTPLAMKCRTLQQISPSRILGATDTGYFEVDIADGKILRQVRLESEGVIAAFRCPNGTTLLTGINLAGQHGVTFSEYDNHSQLRRSVCYPGDYVRGSTLTEADTILFTNNDRVLEGDWSGKIFRGFSAAGFLHAWKALRLQNGHTIISAGYGAFVVEFDGHCREVRRWECGSNLAFVRPFFFGDFTLLADGSLVVCNWLGHGTALGGTGYTLLQFHPNGTVVKAWQDAERTSSLQAVMLLNT